MTLTFSSRTIGDITVLKCYGNIVEGPESTALRKRVNEVLDATPAIVLDLGNVPVIDSGGLGMLVRILARTGRDNLKLCGLTNRISETLRITRLAAVFDCYPSEAEAIAAFYRSDRFGSAVAVCRAECALRGQVRRSTRVYAGSAASGRIERDRDKQPA